MLTDNEAVNLINKWTKEANDHKTRSQQCWIASDWDGANSHSMAEGILRRVAAELYKKLNG